MIRKISFKKKKGEMYTQVTEKQIYLALGYVEGCLALLLIKEMQGK